MANSKYEYVKKFEKSDELLPDVYIVVRIDGRGFHKISSVYKFERPNDSRALELMNCAAVAVMEKHPDITIAYGISDEFRLISQALSSIETRLCSSGEKVVSTFTAHYLLNWPKFLPPIDANFPIPTFDARAILYPNANVLKDYMRWRQVDCNSQDLVAEMILTPEGHINNLYNTAFWTLVQKGGLTNSEAEQKLSGTESAGKNEILFSQFGINYNKEPEMYKKGSVIHRGPPVPKKQRSRRDIVTAHIDLMQEEFWEQRGWLL